MKPSRWLPYGSLQTRHLRLVLGTARVIAWIGMLLIAGGSAAAAGPYAMMAATSVIGLIGYGLLALALSGVLAALVGIEESQRRRVERD
jgi:hypothetical protein